MESTSLLNPNVLAWATFCTVIIGACVSVLRDDNKALPFSVSTSTRAAIAVALGGVQIALTTIVGGTPWPEAVGTAVASVIVAFAAHGAPRDTAKKDNGGAP